MTHRALRRGDKCQRSRGGTASPVCCGAAGKHRQAAVPARGPSSPGLGSGWEAHPQHHGDLAQSWLQLPPRAQGEMAEHRHGTTGRLDSHEESLSSHKFAVPLHAGTKLSASGVCGTAGGNASATADDGCLREV